MTFREDLVGIYARQPIEAVEMDPRFQKLCREHAANRLFQEERHRVEVGKTEVEATLGAPNQTANQVRKALDQILRLRRPGSAPSEKQVLIVDLIRRGYWPEWKPAQQEYFNSAYERMTRRYDFFFSFTTRREDVAGDNPINTRYRYFIRAELDRKYLRLRDQRKENLLATVAYRLLSSAPLKGFFFPHREGDSSVPEQKLLEALKDSVAFVQLVQNVMFTEPMPMRTNYCFWEYEKALEATSSRFFVVAEGAPEDLAKPYFVPNEYNGWYGDVAASNPSYLPLAEDYDPTRIKALRETFRKIFKRDLRGIWDAVLERVPD